MKLIRISIITGIIMLLAFATVKGQDLRDEKFRKGTEYYTSDNFNDALNEWMDIYNTGYSSSPLLYNIGNAHFKLDNIPGAVLFYERARLLNPSDENINYNLQIARSRVVDKFEEIPELFFVRWFDFMALMIPGNSWAYTSLISFLIFLAALSAYIYSSKYRLKVAGFWIALSFFILTLVSLSFALRNKKLIIDNREAIIMVPSVNGKSSPDNSGTDLFVIHEGSKVTVEDEMGDWFEIKLSDGNKGWIPSGSLEVI